MILKKITDISGVTRDDGITLGDFFGAAERAGVKMGYAVFPPGSEAPPAAHDADEYAYIISGSVKSQIGGKVTELKAGCASFIPAGEEHVSFNDGDEACNLVWMLVDPA
ncbi:MAG: cupin domain-containing protein [Oscillospiraceae bacterium]|nr:cupin domain-containing protein [Oscillospiraceae bacterium]